MKENSNIRMKMSIANELFTANGNTRTIAASAASESAFHLLRFCTTALSRRQDRLA